MIKLNNLRQSDLNEFLLLLFSSMIFNGSRLIIDLGASKVLTISQYGRWAFVIIIGTYLTNLHFGVLNGMAREIPIALGSKKEYRSEAMKIATLQIISLVIVIVGVILSLLAFFLGDKNLYASILMVFSGLLFYQFVQSVLRAEQKFQQSSYHQGLSGIFILFFCLISIYFYKDFGLALGFGVALIFSSLFFLRYLSLKIMKVKRQVFIDLAKKGFPIFYVGFVYLAFTSIDRIMVQLYLGQNSLAIYHFANTLFTIGLLFITVLATQLYPKLLHSFGETKDLAVVRGLLSDQIKISTLLSIVLAVILSMLIYFFIPIFFAEFEEAVVIAITLLFGLPALSVALILSAYYHVIMQQRRLIPVMLGPLLLNVLVVSLFVKLDYGIMVFAIASTTSFYIYAFFMIRDYLRLSSTLNNS